MRFTSKNKEYNYNYKRLAVTFDMDEFGDHILFTKLQKKYNLSDKRSMSKFIKYLVKEAVKNSE